MDRNKISDPSGSQDSQRRDAEMLISRFPHSMEVVSSDSEGSVYSFTTCLSMTYQVWGAASSTAGCYDNPSPALWNPQFLTRQRNPLYVSASSLLHLGHTLCHILCRNQHCLSDNHQNGLHCFFALSLGINCYSLYLEHSLSPLFQANSC